MIATIDSSVLVAAMAREELHHAECMALLNRRNLHLYSHGIPETFSTLTGGRLAIRYPASQVVSFLEKDYLPDLKLVELSPKEKIAALQEAESRGVRGGAIYDYLHLVAAKKCCAERLYTLDLSHFRAIRRDGDPKILLP
ncbi:MAG: PIN domain-containing protein [Verrucomicrobiales bacterium]